MKIRTLIAQCAAAAAITAGGLTLTTGTAHAAVNCNTIRDQITTYKKQVDCDYLQVAYYVLMGDMTQANYWGGWAADDQSIVDMYQSQFRMAHCA